MYYQVHFITRKPKHKSYLLFLEADEKKKQNQGQKRYVGVQLQGYKGEKKATIQLTKVATNCSCVLQAEED